MKRSHREDTKSSGNVLPNLPPIKNGSPMVSQRLEQELEGRVFKTKTTPSSAFMQTAVETLYSDSEQGTVKEETEYRHSSRRKHTPMVSHGEEETGHSPRRSRSVKQNAFMREKTLAIVPHPPTTNHSQQQLVMYPKSTKSADQRYEQSRIGSKQQTPAATAITSYATHHKPKYDNIVEGREKTIETRSPTRDHSTKQLNKYERKLKRLQDRYDGNRYLKPQKSHPYLESKSFLGRGGDDGKGGQRNPQLVELEKKAKALTEKAMKVSLLCINYHQCVM